MKPVEANDSEDLLETDDVQFSGTQDLWKVLTKAYSEEDEWSDSTVAMKVPGGVVIRSVFYNDDTNSMAMVFVPGADLKQNEEGNFEIV